MKIRNPHAKTEWLGTWNDQHEYWNEIQVSDKNEYHTVEEDGAFWMAWEDWLEEFETLDICYMPDEE